MLTINNILLFHFNIYIFTSYAFLCSKNHYNLYRVFKQLFTNKQKTLELLHTSVVAVCIEEICFRIYLPELLSYFIANTLYINIITCLAFSIGHIINYFQARQFNLHNFRISLAQIIFTFILSYCFLLDNTPLITLLLHQYNNLHVNYK